jgi:hypothetical protein
MLCKTNGIKMFQKLMNQYYLQNYEEGVSNFNDGCPNYDFLN